MQRDPKLLVSNRAQLADTAFRQIARYDEKCVIVEWKDVDKGLESKLKHRIAKVASLLASIQDPTFHSLLCLCFLKDPQSGRYAYMFDPPSFAAHSVRSAVTSYSTPSPAFSMKSLDQLYSLPTMRPSLNHRLKIAKALAETVLQLHTAGWLHKCIRTDNVLCFVPNTKAWDSIDQQPLVYLSGYKYARADNPLETTEDPSTLRHARMYRHPLSLGQGRASFAKHFDLYSLGCVLLEIGIWAPLQTILLSWLRQESGKVQDCPVQMSAGSTLEPRDDAEFYLMLGEKQRLLGEAGRGSVFAELKFNMGAAYAQIVARCLQASSQSVKIGADDEDFDDSLDIQENSLATLHQLLEAV